MASVEDSALIVIWQAEGVLMESLGVDAIAAGSSIRAVARAEGGTPLGVAMAILARTNAVLQPALLRPRCQHLPVAR